jgi:hypothetical protein
VEYSLERSGRPTYTKFDASQSNVRGTSNVELKSAGEDLDQEGGVMEMMWDLLYWTWGCTCMAGVLGDWGWSLWVSFKLSFLFEEKRESNFRCS